MTSMIKPGFFDLVEEHLQAIEQGDVVVGEPEFIPTNNTVANIVYSKGLPGDDRSIIALSHFISTMFYVQVTDEEIADPETFISGAGPYEGKSCIYYRWPEGRINIAETRANIDVMKRLLCETDDRLALDMGQIAIGPITNGLKDSLINLLSNIQQYDAPSRVSSMSFYDTNGPEKSYLIFDREYYQQLFRNEKNFNPVRRPEKILPDLTLSMN